MLLVLKISWYTFKTSLTKRKLTTFESLHGTPRISNGSIEYIPVYIGTGQEVNLGNEGQEQEQEIQKAVQDALNKLGEYQKAESEKTIDKTINKICEAIVDHDYQQGRNESGLLRTKQVYKILYWSIASLSTGALLALQPSWLKNQRMIDFCTENCPKVLKVMSHLLNGTPL